MKIRLLMLPLMMFGATVAKAQLVPVIDHPEVPTIEPLKLSGPRVGFSYLNRVPEELNTRIQDAFGKDTRLSPFVSQFGWQFEWRYFETPGGDAGVLELIPMIGGLDQGIVIPSLNTLVGYRHSSGFEVGFGPNITMVQTGFVFACGYNFHNGYMNFPVNLALVPGRDATRISLTFGFNSRSRN